VRFTPSESNLIPENESQLLQPSFYKEPSNFRLCPEIVLTSGLTHKAGGGNSKRKRIEIELSLYSLHFINL